MEKAADSTRLASPSADHLDIIAHRGASGYLPEHTLAAKALAYGLGADYLEQDVVLTQDDQPIVLHDVHLDTVTDVAQQFAGRHREDGRFYAIDFSLAEIQTLRVHERTDRGTGKAVFPSRFPVGKSVFRIPTLREELELIQGLNTSFRRQIGIYPEIKAPSWHRAQGKDISQVVLATLRDYGYDEAQDRAFVQCFDPVETRRIREELGSRLRLIQLIAGDTPQEADVFGPMRTPTGLRKVAEYAQGIGPALEHVLTGNQGNVTATRLVADAHENGLVVHPYTVRNDALPTLARNHDELLELLVERARVDGLFTDFPDLAVRWRATRRGGS